LVKEIFSLCSKDNAFKKENSNKGALLAMLRGIAAYS